MSTRLQTTKTPKSDGDINLSTLYKMNREELLQLCENDPVILELCNKDERLNRIITAPKSVF